jgi:hypothetical protein
MKRKGVFLFATIVAATSDAMSPPVIPFDDIDWAAPLTRKPTTGLIMGRLHVMFEKTRLSDVLQEAGGAIAEQGDAGEHVLWLCYTITNKSQTQRLWITSSGEMGGRDHTVSGILAQVVSDGPTSDCPTLPTALRPVSLSNHLWLGITQTRLVSIFGASPGIRGAWRGYLYQGKLKGSCEPDGFDVLNSIEWTTNDGLLDAIDASQVTSC